MGEIRKGHDAVKWEKLKGRDHLRNLGIHGRIILKLNLKI
jgi:hypothetical protein